VHTHTTSIYPSQIIAHWGADIHYLDVRVARGEEQCVCKGGGG
jgi:hypothetical protein